MEKKKSKSEFVCTVIASFIVLGLFIAILVTNIIIIRGHCALSNSQESRANYQAFTAISDTSYGTPRPGGIDGTEARGTTRTFIDIPLSGIDFFPPRAGVNPFDPIGLITFFGTGGFDWSMVRRAGLNPGGSRGYFNDVTLLIHFLEVTVPSGAHEGRTLLSTSVATRVSMPSHGPVASSGRGIRISNQLLTIYVMDSWYLLMRDGNSFNNNRHRIGISMYHNGVAFPLSRQVNNGYVHYFNIPQLNIEQRPASPGIDDPYDPNFNPGGGGGTVGNTWFDGNVPPWWLIAIGLVAGTFVLIVIGFVMLYVLERLPRIRKDKS